MAIDSPAPSPAQIQQQQQTVLPIPPPPPAPVFLPISPPRQPQVQLTIPLDTESIYSDDTIPAPAARVKPKRKLHRRDSLDRREALLKGNEGSRRRQRWENDRFTNNPAYTPPTRADWIPAPHYHFHTVPYHFAALWDRPEYIRRREAASLAAQHRHQRGVVGNIPKGLKERVKKKHGTLALVEALEREVRGWVFGEHGEPEPESSSSGNESSGEEQGSMVGSMVVIGDHADGDNDDDAICDDTGSESEEEQIVFVSKAARRAGMEPARPPPAAEAPSPTAANPEKEEWMERMVFEGEVGDSFGRWVVHAIAQYYGLHSWSVSAGEPEMRYAFVGKKGWEEVKRRVPLFTLL